MGCTNESLPTLLMIIEMPGGGERDVVCFFLLLFFVVFLQFGGNRVKHFHSFVEV